MSDAKDTARETPVQRLRTPKIMWDAYGRVCTRLETNRTARLLDHIRADIQAHGDEQDLADLKKGDAELTERRARMHPGRPRKASGE